MPLVAVGVAVACVVLLAVIGLVGARRRPSGGPLVIGGRVVFVLLLVAVVVAIGAGLWWSIGGALASLS